MFVYFIYKYEQSLYANFTSISGKPKKHKITPEERANPNLLLVANSKLKVWDRDPLTYSKYVRLDIDHLLG